MSNKTESLNIAVKNFLDAVKSREEQQDDFAQRLDQQQQRHDTRLRVVELSAHGTDTKVTVLMWLVGVCMPLIIGGIIFVLTQLNNLAAKLPVKP